MQKKSGFNVGTVFFGFSAAVLAASIVYSVGTKGLQGALSTPARMTNETGRPSDTLNRYPMGIPATPPNTNACGSCSNTYSACHAEGVQALMTGNKIIFNLRPISANDFLNNCLSTFKTCKAAFQCK